MRRIELSGEWHIRDNNNEYSIPIKLPATTEMAKIPINGINYDCETTHLRRLYPVNQNLYYRKYIEVDNYFAKKPLELNLERTKYTKVYIDGEFVSYSHDTVTMQHHKIKMLSKGRHEIIIAVDNNLIKHEDFDRAFLDGHQYSEHTQTNWNGILGEMYICVDKERKEEDIVLKDNIKVIGNKIYDNGERINLRGNVDCCMFPRTGACPFTKEEWITIFQKYKEYGLNHCRFHSWCPPKSAFVAADELDIYLQVEMSAFALTLSEKDNEERNKIIYNYFYNNGVKILKEYGNHKSFVIFAIGNELNGDESVFNKLVSELKKIRNDILITSGANNFLEQPKTLENDDVWITMKTALGANIRGSYSHGDLPLGRLQTKERLSTNWNYDKAAKVSKKPLISHEVGQYQVSPNLSDEDKYIGITVNDILKDYGAKLLDRGRYERWEDYFVNSGKLVKFLYKNEIEALLRSDNISGFQLLGLNDFQGQGMALVGVLNSFYENKGIISQKEWREFCNDTVILLKFNSYVYEKNDIIDITVMLYNYSNKDYTNEKMIVTLEYENNIIAENVLEIVDGSRGLKSVGEVTFDTADYEYLTPVKLKLSARVNDITNHYDIYVMPNEIAKNPQNVRMIYKLTDDDMKFIKNGGKVIHIDDSEIECMFTTDFWCYDMFKKACESAGKKVAPGTMGLFINKQHKALEQFAKNTYADASWQQIMVNSKVLNVNDKKCDNIIEVIDNFNRSDNLSLMYEQKIGKGILITTGCDFYKHMDKVEVCALYNSVINYLLLTQ